MSLTQMLGPTLLLPFAGDSSPLDVGRVEEVGAYLDALRPDERLAEVRSLKGAQMARLFAAAEGVHHMSLDDVVPRSVGTLTEVVHEGKNSLPAFSTFAKVFCRPDDERGEQELWGYYRQPLGIVETTVGPGYFIARVERDGEVLIDYLRQPPRKIPGWPPILPNSSRLSLFVYHNMQDVLRRVSEHVSIGRARRKERWMNAYFALCRQD